MTRVAGEMGGGCRIQNCFVELIIMGFCSCIRLYPAMFCKFQTCPRVCVVLLAVRLRASLRWRITYYNTCICALPRYYAPVKVRRYTSCTNVLTDTIVYVNNGSLCRSVIPTHSAPQQIVSTNAMHNKAPLGKGLGEEMTACVSLCLFSFGHFHVQGGNDSNTSKQNTSPTSTHHAV